MALFDTLKDSHESTSQAIVLCDDEGVQKCMTYRAVFVLCRKLIETLKTVEIQPGQCCGLLMKHSVYLPSIIISLQKLGCPFTFFDMNILEETITNVEINWILAFEKHELKGFTLISQMEIEEENAIHIWKCNQQHHYIPIEGIFMMVQSSGTTGKKKLIKVPYSCIKENVTELSKIFQVTSKDVIFWGTPLTFDPSYVELLLSLLNKACLLIVPYECHLNSYTLFNAIFCVGKITFLQIVPSLFLRWEKYQQEFILKEEILRILAFGGENFPKSILQFKKSSKLRIFNLYGITEVSCWATINEVTSMGSNEILLGKNLPSTLIEIRDVNGLSVPEGEIFIGSTTRVCYIDKETPENISFPLFRPTGDIGKITKYGLQYISRQNNVIKRFGQKVNISELEQLIFNKIGLETKCIWLENLQKLFIILVIEDHFSKAYKDQLVDNIRAKILRLVPECSFPDHIEALNKLPLTLHGKVDTKQLEKLYLITRLETENASLGDIFTNIWCKYLGLNTEILKSYKNYTFLQFGGNSITFLQMMNELEQLIKYKNNEQLKNLVIGEPFENCLGLIESFKNTQNSDDENFPKKLKVCEKLQISWKYNLNSCVDSSPLVFQRSGEVYIAVGSFAGVFVVLNQLGQVVFKKIFPKSIQSTPILSKCSNFLYIGCFNGSVYCIEFLKQLITWEFQTDGIIASSPCLCRKDSAIICGSYDNHVYCIGVNDGNVLWKSFLGGSVSADPITDQTGKIFVTTTKGSVYCYDESGEVIWKRPLDSIFGTPCLINSTKHIVISTVNGTLFCLSVDDGRTQWTFTAGNQIYSSLTTIREYVAFASYDGTVQVIQPSLDSCKLFAKVKLDSPISTSICTITHEDGDYLVSACNSGFIYYLKFKNTLEITSEVKLPSEVFSSPSYFDGKIFVGCRDNYLYCLNL